MPKRKSLNYGHLPARLALLAVAVFTVGLLFGGGTASAAQNDVSDTVKYCKSKMPKAVDGQCTTANMNQARAIFNDSCNKKAPCIEQGAESVVDEVAQKKPKNKKDFNDALDAAIKDKTPKAGGGPAAGGDPSSGPTPTGQGKNCDNNSCDLISLYINPAISILSVIIGLVCAGSLVMAGIQYTSASGDPQKIGAAKTRITNTLLAFLTYLFLYAFMNFLIPGGLFG